MLLAVTTTAMTLTLRRVLAGLRGTRSVTLAGRLRALLLARRITAATTTAAAVLRTLAVLSMRRGGTLEAHGRARGGAVVETLELKLRHLLADETLDGLDVAGLVGRGQREGVAGHVKKEGTRKAVTIPSLALAYEADTLQVR